MDRIQGLLGYLCIFTLAIIFGEILIIAFISVINKKIDYLLNHVFFYGCDFAKTSSLLSSVPLKTSVTTKIRPVYVDENIKEVLK